MQNNCSDYRDCTELTTNAGAPVYDTANSQTVGPDGPVLLQDAKFIEKMAHFDRERIPERVVHAKGAAAFGYFKLYRSMSEYTYADFLQNPSKATKILIRFSTVIGYRGSEDTARDPRGFAVKFYTRQGNYDVVGLNFPVFFIRDAMKFPDFIHSQKPSPKTNIQDKQRLWDFYSLSPETLHMLTWLYSDRGIVKNYKRMDGFGVNTFVWVNKEGKRRYVKYHFLTQDKKDIIDRQEAKRLAGIDPDIAVRTLYSDIEAGRPARYEFCVQMMEPEMAQKLPFDPLDDTKIWPEKMFPLMKVGMLTLDKNPENYFAQVEQAAFAPSNLVPGIEFSADKMLQGRTFAYADTQRYRIGANFLQLPVNRPIVPVCNDTQDGFMAYDYSCSDTNYKPNNLADNRPKEACAPGYPGVYYAGRAERREIRKADDFTQARERYMSLDCAQRDRMADAIGFELAQCKRCIIEKQLALFERVSPDMANRIRNQIHLFWRRRTSNGSRG